MNFEESLYQLQKAYANFEELLLKSALNYLNFPTADWNFFQNLGLEANIPVCSFLNSITSVRDQAPKLENGTKSTSVKTKLIELWNNKKQSSTSFAFVERLRNYSQHKTQPIDKVNIGASWDGDLPLCEHRVNVYVRVADVCNNRDIKSAERDSYLEDFGELADVSVLIREAMGSVAEFSVSIRSVFQDSLNNHEQNYNEYLNYNGRSERVGFDISKMENGEVMEEFQIFPDFLERLKKLREIRYLKNNSKHYISNRHAGHSIGVNLKLKYESR